MGLVNSLLTAIVRADGDALVLHVGERPYIVAPSGQSELSTRLLTFGAMSGMLGELVPAEAQRALQEYGAVQQEMPLLAAVPDERFTVVAARGGEDIWIEIRRRRKEPDVPVVVETAEPSGLDIISSSEPPAENEQPPQDMTAEPMEQVEEPMLAIELIEDEVAEDTSVEAESLEDKSMEEKTIDDKSIEATFVEDVSPAAKSIDEESGDDQPFEIHVEEEAPSEPGVSAAVIRKEAETYPAIVVPLARNQVRGEQPGRLSHPSRAAAIDRLLRIAAARGASTLYFTSQSRPSIRVDGQISAIEGESTLSEPDVEALMLDSIPERHRQALRCNAGAEWICEVPDVGRVRCVSFRDHRGAGGIFRMVPARAISADQLGLSREIQGLCAEAEGLVLVTGPRSSGKSTLILAFVDLINRTRSDHVITLESEITFVHESRGSLVSQREVRGDDQELVAVARAALRENPDVLVIEDLRSPEILTVALEAAQSGHLVIGALTARTTAEAIDRVIDQTSPDRRPKIQLALAEALRGVVAQVLLRKTGSGRVAAREVLLNTSAVANLIAEGKTSQLPMAIESGRKHGMVPLNDALAAFVESGSVDSREAYRRAPDQPGFLSLLKRQGIDTSFVERLA